MVFSRNYASKIDFDPTDYFNYDRLKVLIHALNNEPDHSFILFSVHRNKCDIPTSYVEIRQMFLTEFIKEVQLVDSFFAVQLKALSTQLDYITVGEETDGTDNEEAEGEIRLISGETEAYDDQTSSNDDNGIHPMPSSLMALHPLPSRKTARVSSRALANSIKRALQVLSQNLVKIENYQLVNTTAFIKILKKFDKVHDFRKSSESSYINTKAYDEAMEKLMEFSIMSPDSTTKHLKNRLENIYAQQFCKGDKLEAAQKLQLDKGVAKEASKFFFQIKIGFLLCMILWFAFDLAQRNSYKVIVWSDPSIYLFGFVGNIIAYNWFWGLTIQAWEVSNINYILLLQYKHKNFTRFERLYEDSVDMSIGYLFCYIMYLNSLRENNGRLFEAIPAYTFIICLLPITFYRVIHSYFISKDYHGVFSKKVLFKLLTPWSGSNLVDRYAGDMLCSLSKEFSLLAYCSCYVFSGSLVLEEPESLTNFGGCNRSEVEIGAAFLALLPFIIRLIQTIRRQYDQGNSSIIVWPHSINSLKYAGSILVILLGAFHKISNFSTVGYRIYFILLCAAITIFQNWFDVVVDWGLWRITLTSEFTFWGLFTGPTSTARKLIFAKASHVSISRILLRSTCTKPNLTSVMDALAAAP